MLMQFKAMQERINKELGYVNPLQRVRNFSAKLCQHYDYKMIKISTEQGGHKYVIIPTNARLKREENKLSNFIFNKFGVRIRPYSGHFSNDSDEESDSSNAKNESVSEEDLLYGIGDVLEELDEEEAEGFEEIKLYDSEEECRIVNNLPIFDNYCSMPNLKNGHSKIDDNSIDFGYVLELEQFNPIGAIYFKVNLYSKEAEIVSLGIKPNYRNQGLGTKLLDFCLYIIALYGCNRIYLESSSDAKTLYLRHGFYFFAWGKEIPWQNYCEQIARGQDVEDDSPYLELWSTNRKGWTNLKASVEKNLGYPVDIIQLLHETQRYQEWYEEDFRAIERVSEKVYKQPNVIMMQRVKKRKEEFERIIKTPSDAFHFYSIMLHSQCQEEDIARKKFKVRGSETR